MRKFIAINQRLSTKFDSVFVPKKWRVDGLKDYCNTVIPPLVGESKVIYDIGGGKRPYIGTEIPLSPGKQVVGLDIDAAELHQAPKGAYAKTFTGDIGDTKLLTQLDKSTPKADLVICQAVLEHVENTPQAISNMAAMTKSGGVVTIFVPSRHALFATINRYMPQAFKQKVLFSIFPETSHAQGFEAFYNHCTVGKFKKLCREQGLKVESTKTYFQSNYFSFLLPAHMLWRLYQFVLYIFLRENAAESFTIVARKN